MELDLYEGCSVVLQKRWYKKEKADQLLYDIKTQIPFGFYEKMIFGKLQNVPRGIFAFGDPGICTNDRKGRVVEGTGHVYGRPKAKYMSFDWNTSIGVFQSDIDVPPDAIQPVELSYLSDEEPTGKPVGKTIYSIMKHINKVSSDELNSVLLNAYRDGNDSISAHSDQEIIPPNNEVYALSLGESRTMHFVSLDKTDKHKIEIEHGDLLIMSGDTQQYYTHEIRKQPTKKNLRVSLTFRCLPK
jgi:hypothetical protein